LAHAERALASLASCERIQASHVVVYCDGPRGEEDCAEVEATRAVVRTWAPRLEAEVVERPVNLGLARSIVDGVTDLCERFGRVIVVEEDLVLDPGFVRYMLEALDLYQDDPRVFQVSGFMFGIEPTPGADALFLPLTTTWGWATWARAWQAFDWGASDARIALTDPAVGRAFDLDRSHPFAALLLDRLAGRNDSWGILWWWAVFRRAGLVLYPRRSLVRNLGFDGSGVHCRPENDLGSSARLTGWTWPREARFPAQVVPDHETLQRVASFLKAQGQPGLMATLYRWLRSALHRRGRATSVNPCP
jgi:hypothetical protein